MTPPNLHILVLPSLVHSLQQHDPRRLVRPPYAPVFHVDAWYSYVPQLCVWSNATGRCSRLHRLAVWSIVYTGMAAPWSNEQSPHFTTEIYRHIFVLLLWSRPIAPLLLATSRRAPRAIGAHHLITLCSSTAHVQLRACAVALRCCQCTLLHPLIVLELSA